MHSTTVVRRQIRTRLNSMDNATVAQRFPSLTAKRTDLLARWVSPANDLITRTSLNNQIRAVDYELQVLQSIADQRGIAFCPKCSREVRISEIKRVNHSSN